MAQKTEKYFRKKIKSFGGKNVSWKKKVCAYELCLVLIRKYTESFGGKNPAMCSLFLPIKSKVYILFQH